MTSGASIARQPTRVTDAEVTLVIFSGRVDPVWVLTPAETVEFRHRLEKLSRAPEPYAAPATLGYLQMLLPDAGRRRQTVTFDHGRVIWADGKVLHSLTDPNRALEAWLLATGRGKTSQGDGWFTIGDLDKHPYHPPY